MTLHHSSGRWQLGLSLALFTASLWGVLPIALKLVLQAVDVYTVTWFRFLISFSLLIAFLAARGRLSELQKLRTARLELLAIATLGLALNYLLFMQGLHQTSPTNSQVIIQLAPIFLALGAIFIFKERYTLKQWIGMGLLTLGLSLFFEDKLRLLVTTSNQYVIGSGLLVLAGLVWAFYALAQKQLLQHLSSQVIMLVIYGGSALLFAPAASPETLLQLTPTQWGMLLFSGFNTFLAYGSFAEALDHWDASRVSAVLSLTPIITLIIVGVGAAIAPSFVESEPITGLGILGAIFVVLGSWAIALGQRVSKPKPQG
ncbi:MAG TPA: DMT family transporter [Crinalium sp.]|jgi:drug/metabolite transporter (DMT)-like permease